MFEGLATAVEELDVPVDAVALASLWGLVDRLTAKATMASSAFDQAGLWDVDGATSMTAWLRHRAGMSSRDAALTARTGKRLAQAPVTASAWVEGGLSGAQVAAVVANLDDDRADLWAEHEPDMVPRLVPLPAHQVGAVMQVWAERADATLNKPEKAERPDRLHLSRTTAGRGELTGSLRAELADLVSTALRLATTKDAKGEPVRTPAERRADALADVCRFFLDHQQGVAGGRHRPHVNAIVELDAHTAGRPGAAWTADGFALSTETIKRLLCDCGIHRVVTRGRSTILDYGTRTQTIPAPLFNSLVIRDEHCRWPGCDRPSSWCDGHHVWHWEDGGPTRLDNLVLLCRRHHTKVHKRGWQVKLLPDATLEVTNPTGIVETTRPPPRRRAGDLGDQGESAPTVGPCPTSLPHRSGRGSAAR